MMTDEIETLKALETKRARVLIAGDRKRLEAMCDVDLVHVHTNGLVDNRDSYLKMAIEKLEFLDIAREHLHVRLFGDVAQMTGVLKQQVRIRATGDTVDLKAFVTQVWLKRDGNWSQIGFQATKID